MALKIDIVTKKDFLTAFERLEIAKVNQWKSSWTSWDQIELVFGELDVKFHPQPR